MWLISSPAALHTVHLRRSITSLASLASTAATARLAVESWLARRERAFTRCRRSRRVESLLLTALMLTLMPVPPMAAREWPPIEVTGAGRGRGAGLDR